LTEQAKGPRLPVALSLQLFGRPALQDLGFETLKNASLAVCRALSEKPQQVEHQQDQQNCADPDASASGITPPAVAVVSSAATEKQYQNNNQNNQSHLTSPFSYIWSLSLGN
jgi:hypothetical protein